MCEPTTKSKNRSNHASSSPNTSVLSGNVDMNKLLFLFVAFLCGFMVFWIMVFPSSWLLGLSKRQDNLVHYYLVKDYKGGGEISPKTITKYAGHPAIQLSHILPAALWAASIPFQIHPDFRKTYKTAHRRIGYAFIISSILMTFGLVLIMIRNLTFEHDYDGETAPMEDTDQLLSKAFVSVLGSWFAFTSVMALLKARGKDFRSHKHYIYRHCGSGLWVAIQRLFIMACGPQKDASRMRGFFATAAMYGVVISISLAEVAVYLDKKQQKSRKVP
eukprot:scaffold8211_cov117-Cylindrotheca_fusiformis.AAC.12